MINNDEIINKCETGCEEQPAFGTSQKEYSPSSSPLCLLSAKSGLDSVSDGKSAPKGRINSALRSGGLPPRFVPVVDFNNVPLMPTKPSRARAWIKSRKATPFYVRGIFCVRLNQEPSARHYQEIACGIDPGSKKEGYSLKSKAHTYLNIQADAVTWAKDALKTRREMRRGRRYRNTPYRKNRMNRKRPVVPPSTKARWAWKLRVINVLQRIFPIGTFVVEDINAQTKEGQRKWNVSFGPLQIGKHWFYQEIRKLGKLVLKQGYETKELRDQLGLICGKPQIFKKSKNKLKESWNANCVDAWVLAWSVVGGRSMPDNMDVVYISPIRLHRRQLHALQPGKGGIRRPYGGTQSMGLKRGSLVKHKDLGIVYVGGNSKDKITFYDIHTGKLFKRKYIIGDCKILTWNTWRTWAKGTPPTRGGVPLPIHDGSILAKQII